MARILSPRFYQRNTETVARELLGCRLVRIYRGQRLSGRIIETEAYLGARDRAAHSYGRRRTDRVRSMYLAGGHAYVFFVYGMHFCFNIVTRHADEPEAVLIRALEPVEGIETMRRLRGVKRDRDLSNGPGKLAQALAIDRKFDGMPLTESHQLFIERDRKVTADQIIIGPRVGIDYAEEAILWPLRFQVKISHNP